MMHNRGGFPMRNVIYAVFLLLIFYMVYIYNGSQNLLRDSEMIGARYKKEVEERVTEIQEIVKAKDKLQETCQNDKVELNNRIKSINQQHSMVQSQYKETSADLSKMKQDMETLRLDHARAEEVHKLEYQKMKQDKDNEITRLKDELADTQRRKSDLAATVEELKIQLGQAEDLLQSEKERNQIVEHNILALQTAQKQLSDENQRLQQLRDAAQKQQQQQQLQQQQQQQQPIETKQQQQLQNLDLRHQAQIGNDNANANSLGGAGGGHNFVNHMHVDELGDGFSDIKKHDGARDQFGKFGQADIGSRSGGIDRLAKEVEVAKPQVDEMQAQRQVAPPHNIDVDNIDSLSKMDLNDRDEGLDDEGHDRHEINPNDEQKGQILEPMLDGHDKHLGGGEDGVENMNVRGIEEARERGLKDDDTDDGGFLEHKNPIALGQIEIPDGGNRERDDENVGQQMPPVLKTENEQDNGDQQYFGEDEEAQRLEEDQQEDLQKDQQEEDEGERDKKLFQYEDFYQFRGGKQRNLLRIQP